MHELEKLKNHHLEFKTVVSEIRQLFAGKDIDSVADEAMEVIFKMNAELMVHLTMEERYLYPILLECKNAKVSQRAREMKTEIGGLFCEFQNYRLKWPHAEQVVRDPQNFLADTELIFSAINKRMSMEDELLYPEVMELQLI